jgi:hypothetical protein
METNFVKDDPLVEGIRLVQMINEVDPSLGMFLKSDSYDV